MKRTVASLALAGALSVTCHAGIITQEFAIPWSSGLRVMDIAVDPFAPPSASQPLNSVTISIMGFSRTQLTTATPFGGTVPVSMTQSFGALVEFSDGTDIAIVDRTSTVQEFNLGMESVWFSGLTLAGAVLAPPTAYLPGDALFDRFTGAAPVSISLSLYGGTNLLSPPTPGHIGAITGTEWIVTVSYDFVPAPGGIALAGVAGMIAMRRRRC
ncbi:MAG: hypothetical protein KF705_08680 [Phycisphaeraceae bacterium]|nr:hypothetical protein [Phycisphaeraceae bacterium]